MNLKRWKILWVYSFWCSPISFRISLYLSICMYAKWPLLSYLSLVIPLLILPPHPSKLRSPMTAFIPETQIVGSSDSVPGAEHKVVVTQMSSLPFRVWESRKHIDTDVIITPSSLDAGRSCRNRSKCHEHTLQENWACRKCPEGLSQEVPWSHLDALLCDDCGWWWEHHQVAWLSFLVYFLEPEILFPGSVPDLALSRHSTMRY